MNPQLCSDSSTTPTFSADDYRQAMGPGYPLSLFKEQAELTGETRPTICH